MSCYSWFSLIYLVFCFVTVEGFGNFWFVSDFHVDQNYSRTGNPTNLCHDGETVFPDVGLYGNFLCDSPLSLVNASVEAMRTIQPVPDFIIWTGDNLPHTDDFNPDWDVVFRAIKNITHLLSSAFPKIPIYPCIGNHDTFPPNVLLPNQSSERMYEGYLEKGGWNKFLSESACSTFRQGGFYSEVISPGLRLISLNTILWYTPNNYTKELKDPADQFKWLKETLKMCLLSSEKVYIMGHVPPGYYNRAELDKKNDPTFHRQFLETYLEILHQFSEVIIGQMYGHLHMDTFQLFQFNTGTFKSSSLIASSVTPWHFIDKYNTSLPVYPSIRLMHYSKKDFSLLDYDQFYMNLTKVNEVNQTYSVESNLYEHLYKFTDFYGVPDLSTESLLQVYETLKQNETVFKEFFRLLTAGKQTVPCEKECKVAQLCSMSSISSNEYDLCIKTVNRINFLTHIASNVNTNAILSVTITIVVVFLFAIYVVYQKYWKKNYLKCVSRVEYEPFMNY